MNTMDLVSKDPYKLYINGAYVPSVSGKTQDCVNPATNEVFAKAYYGDVADAELAVKAANGEAVTDVDTGAQWYNAENIDDEMISMLVYD